MEPWAQLVSTTDLHSEPVLIWRNKFSIGRAAGSDLCLSENKMVSSVHCVIERDTMLDNVWLHDKSMNGTAVNLMQKVSKAKVPLKHGDEISVVYRKAEPSLNVSFLFQILEELKREELDTTEENSIEADLTQPYEESFSEITKDVTINNNEISIKRQQSLVDDTESEKTKRIKFGESENQKNILSSDGLKAKKDEEEEVKILVLSQEKTMTEKDKRKVKLRNEKSVSFKEKTKRSSSVDKLRDENIISLNEKTKLSSSVDAEPSTSVVKSNPSSIGEEVDDIEESLLCTICQDILHNSISLQPCMHTFCSGCYSDWMDRSKECPSCRTEVERINKNHIVNNLVEAYLKIHPEKKRSEEELKELDEKNKITIDMMKPPEKRRRFDEYDEDDDDDDDEDDDYEDEDDYLESHDNLPRIPLNQRQFGFVNTAINFGAIRPHKTICRQCPKYCETPMCKAVADDDAAAVSSKSDDDKSGCSSVALRPIAPDYVCIDNQVHILCLCCMEPMPDRRWDRHTRADQDKLPQQECRICRKAFCYLYWGCRPNCDGCLKKFCDLKFDPTTLNGLILENQFETDILKQYLTSKGQTLVDLLRDCVEKLRSGIYYSTNLIGSAATICCMSCGLKSFAELAYQFRMQVPNKQLPGHITARPNCHWGKNCHTQKNKATHAASYNHICDQTRWS